MSDLNKYEKKNRNDKHDRPGLRYICHYRLIIEKSIAIIL